MTTHTPRISLNNFETIINHHTVENGAAYFEYDYIGNVERVAKSTFIATVEEEDEEDYSVYIEIGDDSLVLSHGCNCGFDWGDFCKHKVAVLHYLREYQTQFEAIPLFPFDLVVKKLEERSKVELIELLLDLSKPNIPFREALIDELGLNNDIF